MSRSAISRRRRATRRGPQHRRPRSRAAGRAAVPGREALPRVMAPMLATLGELPVDPGPWRFETKWDGYRALARWDGQRLSLLSRNGLNLIARLPELRGMLANHPKALLIDGELVALDHRGRASFAALQARLGDSAASSLSQRTSAARYAVSYQAFDLLHQDGRSTRGLPYLRRRELLEALGISGGHWKTPPCHADGAALLERVRRQNGEGIIAKRAASAYLPGERTRDWLKVKLQHTDDFVVVGWWSGGREKRLGSLLLGYYDSAGSARAEQPLRYAGKVGTGFSASDRAVLATALAQDELLVPACVGALPHGMGVHWCRPRLVAQIRFTEWTRDGRLRHPAFLGLRLDSEPRSVFHSAEGRR